MQSGIRADCQVHWGLFAAVVHSVAVVTIVSAPCTYCLSGPNSKCPAADIVAVKSAGVKAPVKITTRWHSALPFGPVSDSGAAH